MDGDSSVSKALNYVEFHTLENDVRLRFGAHEMFYHHVHRIVDEQMRINVHDEKITHYDIAKLVKDILFDIKEDQIADNLTSDPVREFDRRKGEALSQLMTDGFNQYTLTFPLNLGLTQQYIDEFSVLEGNFQPIEQDRWVNDYFDTAKSEDSGFLKKFLKVTPNDFLDDRFVYFQIDYEARSEGYALSRVQDLANLALGELNYCIYQSFRNPPSPTSDSSLPYETWAALKEPAFYLVFEDSDYLFPRPMDYGYRRGIGISEKRKQDILDFYSLPELSEDNSVDVDLINSLLAYQDGMTESSKRKSFFSFWRGIENLSQVDSPKSEVKERSRFALEYVRGMDAVFPTLEKAHGEIDDVRNSLAHEGVHIFVGDEHRNYAKVLLDGVIELYFQERGEFDREEFDTFLDYGVEYRKGAGKIISILQQSRFDVR
jgi:hypothetical protein